MAPAFTHKEHFKILALVFCILSISFVFESVSMGTSHWMKIYRNGTDVGLHFGLFNIVKDDLSYHYSDIQEFNVAFQVAPIPVITSYALVVVAGVLVVFMVTCDLATGKMFLLVSFILLLSCFMAIVGATLFLIFSVYNLPSMQNHFRSKFGYNEDLKYSTEASWSLVLFATGSILSVQGSFIFLIIGRKKHTESLEKMEMEELLGVVNSESVI